jgi:hypothetical protein
MEILRLFTVQGEVKPMSEIDSDANQDRNREQQLDESFEAWYEQMENQIHQQEGITRVADRNVFEAADDMDT